jgi:ABC-type multidrug transport system permease subunit
VILLVSGVAFLIGFRVHTDVLGYLAGISIVLLFGYSLSWVFAGVGLAVKDPETAQAAAFPIMAPLVFASTVFVPANLMASWLQPFAEHQPVSVTATAARALMLGTPNDGAILQSLLWSVGIIAVAAPLAVRRFRQAV